MTTDSQIPVFHHPEAGRIGLIADTHVPDRAAAVHGNVFKLFKNADLILHAGDISSPPVLDSLNRLAPVIAVRGNNRGDRQFSPPLPEMCRIRIAHGFDIVMWHGMRTPWHRFTDALLGRSGFFNYIAKRMVRRCRDTLPQSDIVFFGHLHWPYFHFTDDRLFVNPGRAFSNQHSSCAVMEVEKGTVKIKIHPLVPSGLIRESGEWHVFRMDK
ncbi:YfcE family phosphodiesterase [bacterium]|nr:YfcE family phosphodiesterase [bacterium]